MHLLRMLKHPGTFTIHNLHPRMKQLLVELGASESEIKRAMPAPNEIDEALKRHLAVSSAAAGQKAIASVGDRMNAEAETGRRTGVTGAGQRRKMMRGETSGKRGESGLNEDMDLRDIKRLKVCIISH